MINYLKDAMPVLNTPFDAIQAIAKYVKATRINANITMVDLSKRSGIGVATLARIETKGVCSTETLSKILAALGVLDTFISSLTPEDVLSISQLKTMHNRVNRKRVRRKI